MDTAVRGDDCGLVEVEGLSGAAGHPTAGLADQQRAGGDVPRMRLPLPVGVEAAGGDVCQGETGPAPTRINVTGPGTATGTKFRSSRA
jgi:hypothetical protein